MRHVLNEDERGDLVKEAREAYEQTPQQIELKDRDLERAVAQAEARGAPQPAAGHNNYLRQQKRKRWHRHLQRVAGTKQIWEVLAFSGRFEVQMLVDLLHNQRDGETAEPADREQVSDEERRRLYYEKAEAIARHIEGSRLARLRETAGTKVEKLTDEQKDVLAKYDSGELLQKRNEAVVAFGHGRLENARGDYLEWGGSAGGGSRRIIDGWQPPDWRTFLEDGRSQ